MGAFPFIEELSEGRGVQLATAEGRWASATGKSVSAVAALGQNDFVYSPGNPAPHDNVFASWPLLIAAVNSVFGMRRILVDPTFAGDLGPQVPAGTWAVDNVMFYGKVPSSGFLPSLTFDDGAHLTANAIYVENLIVQSSSTSPVITLAGGIGLVFVLFQGAVFGSGTAPFFLAATDSGTFTLQAAGASFVGDGSNPVVTANGAASVEILILEQSILSANATSGTGIIGVPFSPGAVFSVASGFPGPTLVNVQPPQLAGLTPNNQSAQLPFWISQQFLANALAPATVVGFDSVQTSDATPTQLPNLALGNASTPMPNHTGGQVVVRVFARIPSTDQTVSWHAQAAFKRVGATISVGTLTNVGGNALASFAPTGGDAAALAGTTIGFTTTANGLVPNVTGLVAVTIDWTVDVSYFYTHA